MARAVSGTLLAAQQAPKRKPYTRVVINSVDYSSRVLFIEHHEEAYRDYATIILDNHDRIFDFVSLSGYRFRIGYGLTTGAGSEYYETADLWVKTQSKVSSPGQLVCQLYCEGQWMYMRDQRMMALLNELAVGDPDKVGADPYFIGTFEKTKTVYELIESVIENAMGWTLNAFAGTQDGIINSFKPVYSLDGLPNAADVLGGDEIGLIRMTKCYLRPKANLTWDIVFPQDTDAVNEYYYSNQTPQFYEFSENDALVVPNRVVVFADYDPDAPEEPIIVGDTGAYSGVYDEVLHFVLAPTIDNQTDADNLAAAVLTRFKAEELAGYLIVPHDSRVELYDRVKVEDWRGV